MSRAATKSLLPPVTLRLDAISNRHLAQYKNMDKLQHFAQYQIAGLRQGLRCWDEPMLWQDIIMTSATPITDDNPSGCPRKVSFCLRKVGLKSTITETPLRLLHTRLFAGLWSISLDRKAGHPRRNSRMLQKGSQVALLGVCNSWTNKV